MAETSGSSFKDNRNDAGEGGEDVWDALPQKSGGQGVRRLFSGAMVFKLTGAAHAEALGLEGARLFDPIENGRQMREWVEVPSTHAAQWLTLAREALRYVGGI